MTTENKNGMTTLVIMPLEKILIRKRRCWLGEARSTNRI